MMNNSFGQMQMLIDNGANIHAQDKLGSSDNDQNPYPR